MEDRARSFDGAAAEYERHRPEYPPEAIRWVADRLELEDGARVLDLGAGTGKLTRGLLAHGFDVVAVEPGPPMRAQLQAVLPDVEVHEGSAEEIPLPDGSVDAIAAGQAYHWFDPPRALPELHRVLRGGGVALFWNWWDVRDPLQAELAALLGFPRTRPGPAHLPSPPWFRELDRATIESVRETTPAEIVAREATTSAMLVAEPAKREALLDEIRTVANCYGERFPLPQLTYVYAFERLS